MMLSLIVLIAQLNSNIAQRVHTLPGREQIHLTSKCILGFVSDPALNCNAAHFKQTDGYYRPCQKHSDCYRWREPNDWCRLPEGFTWSTSGCYCDKKLGSCAIERFNATAGALEWTFCIADTEFRCGNPPNYGQTLHRNLHDLNRRNENNYRNRIMFVKANQRITPAGDSRNDPDAENQGIFKKKPVGLPSFMYATNHSETSEANPEIQEHSSEIREYQNDAPEEVQRALNDEHFRRAHENNVRYMKILREQEEQYENDLAEYKRRLAEYNAQLEKWRRERQESARRRCKPRHGKSKRNSPNAVPC